jgi:DNA repair exonuclease SbcCD ATPase subunit
METLQYLIQQPFVWGLLLGLLLAGFLWKSSFSAKRVLTREIKRLETDQRDLTNHLNTQLKINASGYQALQAELVDLRQQNENLRVSNAALQQKPGRAEQRQLQITESSIRLMREQAPGFAPAWEKALRQAEADLEAADSGLKKLVRRVMPSFGSSGSSSSPLLIADDKSDG